MTQRYTADDGLNLLTYLEITDLNDNEIQVFRRDWNEIYEKNNNLLQTVQELYTERVVWTCGAGGIDSLRACSIRESIFRSRLVTKELEEKLKQKSLDEVLMGEEN